MVNNALNSQPIRSKNSTQQTTPMKYTRKYTENLPLTNRAQIVLVHAIDMAQNQC